MPRRISTALWARNLAHRSIACSRIDTAASERPRDREPSRLRLRLEATGFGTRTRFAGGRHGRATRGCRLDDGFARRPLAGEQILDLVAGQRLEFEQRLGQRLEIAALFLENLLRLFVTCLDQTLDLGVDLAARLLRDILLARHLIAQE